MRRVLDAVRTLLRPETVEDLPARNVEPFRIDLLSWLFGREALPRDPESPGRRGQGFLSWLLLPEELPGPGAGESAPPHRSFLSELFGGEVLPHDGPRGAGPGGGGGAPQARE